jgi:hypothetical protein
MTFYRRIVSMERVGMKGSVESCLFKVDLGVRGHPSVADEVDDPFFAFIRSKVEAGREVAFGKIKGSVLFLSTSQITRMKRTRCRFADECGSTPH